MLTARVAAAVGTVQISCLLRGGKFCLHRGSLDFAKRHGRSDEMALQRGHCTLNPRNGEERCGLWPGVATWARGSRLAAIRQVPAVGMSSPSDIKPTPVLPVRPPIE
jgi:hypothetical protein